jgi:hypothetical protein
MAEKAGRRAAPSSGRSAVSMGLLLLGLAGGNYKIAEWVVRRSAGHLTGGLLTVMAFTALAELVVDGFVVVGVHRLLRPAVPRALAGLAAVGTALLLVAVPVWVALALR